MNKLKLMKTTLSTDEVVKINEIIENINRINKELISINRDLKLIDQLVNYIYEELQEHINEGDEDEN